MTLPVSPNAIKFSQLNAELNRSNTTQINIGNSILRNLAEKPSGKISLSNLRGKSYSFLLPISTNIANINLRNAAIAAGWNEVSELVFENTGIIYSTSTSTPALTISGSFPNGVFFNNSGLIVGKGGRGGDGGGNAGGNGSAGGTALFVDTNVTINNTGTIAGGGGGGGGGAREVEAPGSARPGGGGGGGAGLGAGGVSGSGASGDQSGGTGTFYTYGAGAATGGGDGGRGGAWGSAGVGGQNGYLTFLFSIGGNSTIYPGGAGGAAGKAVSGNSYITWTAIGSRYGANT